MVLKQMDIMMSNLNSKLSKLTSNRVDLDLELLNQDLEGAEQLLQKTTNPKRMAELTELKAYLKRLIQSSKGGIATILWYEQDEIAASYITEFRDFDKEGISSTDYIKVPSDSSLVSIDYSRLANILAYELMYREYGETNRSIEDKLKDVGVIVTYPDTLLLDVISDDTPYFDSKIFKVSSSPYYSNEDEEVYEYFQGKSFSTKYYAEPVSYSCKHALSFILDELLTKWAGASLQVTLCSINDTSIKCLVKNEEKEEFTALSSGVTTIRLFGRLFDTSPDIHEL